MWILSSKKTNDAGSWQTKVARWTAPLAFGVYLAHPFALTVVKEGARIVAGDAIFSPSASILVAATTILTASVIAFFLSAATTWAFKKIPGLRQTV
jgi:peptidoglycan/LPS O-acetylase OafA/YrhL